jgi:hypothetical protein
MAKEFRLGNNELSEAFIFQTKVAFSFPKGPLRNKKRSALEN